MVELGSILRLTKGKKPVHQSDSAQDGYLPYVDIKAFETGQINSFTDGEKCIPCKAGDVLIVCDGARSGLVGRAMTGYVGSTLAKVTAEGLNNDYLFYFIQGKYALLNTKMKGTGTPHLNVEELKKQKLVIPEKEEQERIVAKIEELFSQLDNSATTAKHAQKQLASYKLAVLNSVFYQGNVSYTTLGTLIEQPRYGTAQKCGYSFNANSIAVYRIPNIDHVSGRISHDDIKYASLKPNEKERLELKENDMLIIRSNGSVSLVGRGAIVTKEDTAGVFAGYLMRIRLKSPSAPLAKYIHFYLNALSAREYIESKAKSTSGVHNINADEVCNLPIPICNNEQLSARIQEIESNLSACSNIEKTIAHILRQEESLRQSILKKAFEGKLI